MRYALVITLLLMAGIARAQTYQSAGCSNGCIVTNPGGSPPFTLTGTLPGTTASGHTLVAQVIESVCNDTYTTTGPSGWVRCGSPVLADDGSGDDMQTTLWTILDAGGTNPAHTWTQSQGGTCDFYLIRMADATGVGSIGPCGSTTSVASQVATLASGSLSPDMNSSLLMVFFQTFSFGDISSVTGSPSLTQRWLDPVASTTFMGDFMGSLALSSNAATSVYTVHNSGTDLMTSFSVILDPPVGPTATPTAGPTPTQTPTATSTPVPSPTPTCAGNVAVRATISEVNGTVACSGGTCAGFSVSIPAGVQATDTLVAVVELSNVVGSASGGSIGYSSFPAGWTHRQDGSTFTDGVGVGDLVGELSIFTALGTASSPTFNTTTNAFAAGSGTLLYHAWIMAVHNTSGYSFANGVGQCNPPDSPNDFCDTNPISGVCTSGPSGHQCGQPIITLPASPDTQILMSNGFTGALLGACFPGCNGTSAGINALEWLLNNVSYVGNNQGATTLLNDFATLGAWSGIAQFSDAACANPVVPSPTPTPPPVTSAAGMAILLRPCTVPTPAPCPGFVQSDTCSAGACTLPCSASAVPFQITPANGRRTEMTVCNQDPTNTLYEVVGIPNTGPITPNSGIPVLPRKCVELTVQPGVPSGQTITQPISVITNGPVICCSYLDKEN